MKTIDSLDKQKTRVLETIYRLWTVLQTGGRAALILLLPFGTVGGMYFVAVRSAEDTAEIPDRNGYAVVLAKAAFNTKTAIGAQLLFSINGHKARLRDPLATDAVLLQVGDVVPVTYRVGKSGTYYVTHFDPPPRKVDLPH